jgi:exodeoxyribonuclease VII large subunit
MRIYTVGEVTDYIKSRLRGDSTLQDLWVRGEVSNYRGPHPSGHLYFSLKDRESVLPCAMFRPDRGGLSFELKEGLRVLARGEIDVYKPRGSYQLIVREMKPDGLGELFLRYQQLREKLKKEGLFEAARKRPLPPFPRRIGVVTSPTGAAIHDILHVLSRRYPLAEVVLAPAVVQGEGAAESIIQGIRLLQRLGGVDVMIVGRGGGSFEDLWAFNEEAVAREIFASQVPVISAVGHETDTSIADFVADFRAPTPSAAAEIATLHLPELIDRIAGIEERLSALLRQRVEEKAQVLDGLRDRLTRGLVHACELSRSRWKVLTEKLAALSPEGVLERGYTIALKGTRIVDSVKAVDVGDDLTLIVRDGEVLSQVTGTRRREDGRGEGALF